MDNSITLKNRLKEARMEMKWSQSDLAAKVNVSRNTISSIETGEFYPSAKLAAMICVVFDKKFEELFYLE